MVSHTMGRTHKETTMTARVGFCCKYLHPDQTQKPKLLEEIQRPLTEKCTLQLPCLCFQTPVQWLCLASLEILVRKVKKACLEIDCLHQ